MKSSVFIDPVERFLFTVMCILALCSSALVAYLFLLKDAWFLGLIFCWVPLMAAGLSARMYLERKQ